MLVKSRLSWLSVVCAGWDVVPRRANVHFFVFSASFLIPRFLHAQQLLLRFTFLPLINQVMWGWGFERVVVQLATKLSPTKNAFSLNRIFGGPVCLTAEHKGTNVYMNWSWVECRTLTDDVEVCLVWRFRKNWIIDRNLTIVAARGIEVQVRQSHDALVWLGELLRQRIVLISWLRKGFSG